MIKLLHPDGECLDEEFEEYLAYAIEGRRRIKEQLNKRKPDGEFASIHFSYIDQHGETIEVHCPESKGVEATVNPNRATPAAAPVAKGKGGASRPTPTKPETDTKTEVERAIEATLAELEPKNFTIRYGDVGYSYKSIFADYLQGANKLVVVDPYIRRDYQIRNFLQLCELAVATGTIKSIELVTGSENAYQEKDVQEKLDEIKEGLADCDIELTYRFDEKIHDREISTDTGWRIQIGRGLDIYQGPISRLKIGWTNYDLRPCMETNVSIFRPTKE